MNSHQDGQGPPKRNSGLQPIRIFSDEWAVLQFLKRWTPQDIKKAIDEDVDLADLMLSNWAKARFISSMAKRNKRVGQEYLSPENVLYWFSVRRPDLHMEIVKSPLGVPWLTKNFIKIRDILDI